MILFLLCSVSAVLAVAIITGYVISAPGYSGAASEHFDGKRFFNPGGRKAAGFGSLLKWITTRRPGKWEEKLNVSPGKKPPARVEKGIRITFVNHATFLIQVDGLNLLTDPIWNGRTSPFEWTGPKRMRPPGIRFEDLPGIDAVIVSHNHYDHLDLTTLKRLFETHKPSIITPLGVKAYLEKKQIQGVTDLDWWKELKLSEDVTVAAVPAQHFSGRGMFDRNTTLWNGFVIRSKTGNLYFAGDTGYNEAMFQEIGKRYAPLRVAMLPIGAYKPVWFMGAIHVSPEEAVKAYLNLHAETGIAMHFGTFPLGDDGQEEPVRDLGKARVKYGIGEDRFLVIDEGSCYESGISVDKEATVA